jgi:hypothetical protein
MKQSKYVGYIIIMLFGIAATISAATSYWLLTFDSNVGRIVEHIMFMPMISNPFITYWLMLNWNKQKI